MWLRSVPMGVIITNSLGVPTERLYFRLKSGQGIAC